MGKNKKKDTSKDPETLKEKGNKSFMSGNYEDAI